MALQMGIRVGDSVTIKTSEGDVTIELIDNRRISIDAPSSIKIVRTELLRGDGK
jgi:sRNA-binding carbon storage regulator CsrA